MTSFFEDDWWYYFWNTCTFFTSPFWSLPPSSRSQRKIGTRKLRPDETPDTTTSVEQDILINSHTLDKFPRRGLNRNEPRGASGWQCPPSSPNWWPRGPRPSPAGEHRSCSVKEWKNSKTLYFSCVIIFYLYSEIITVFPKSSIFLLFHVNLQYIFI